MDPKYLTRQYDILSPEQTQLKISIMGAGAIGSQVTMCLAKMGFQDLIAFDFDNIDDENINNQWYGPDQVGMPKINGLALNVYQMTNLVLGISTEKGDEQTKDRLEDIVIASVDSMTARKSLYDRAKKLYKCRWFIDPRMSAEKGAVYVVDLTSDKSKEQYEKSLYSDEEAVQEKCTAKATMYCSMYIASQVCKIVKDIAVDKKPIRKIYFDMTKDAQLVVMSK